MIRRLAFLLPLFALGLSLSQPGRAQRMYDVREKLGFDQNLDTPLPLDAEFTDENGKRVKLGDYFEDGKPVILLFAFYKCQGVCAMEFQGLLEALNGMTTYHAGIDYTFVNVGIHPKETFELARAKKAELLESYRRPRADEGIHTLVGTEENINKVTKAAGFRYYYNEAQNTIDHPSGLVVVTPEGRISRYMFGVSYPSKMLRDAMITASANKIGGKEANTGFLVCWQYDPTTGKYRVVVENVLKVSGILTVILLGASMAVMSIKNRKRGASA
ncbi:MAG: SCO family protein [Fimbriimonadaceae bacterium]|nr:SCO family protein [Fimbriimonadaceae bacterium]